MKNFRTLTSSLVATVVVLGFSACDKISELTGGEAAATGDVASVDEAACKKLISEEERLVVVEFYTDT
ncbi:MAG: hypothetical protein ACPG32_07650 [Akkermansiaceae bacterium]